MSKQKELDFIWQFIVTVLIVFLLIATQSTKERIDNLEQKIADLSEENVVSINVSTNEEKTIVEPIRGIAGVCEQPFYENGCGEELETVEPEWIDYLCTAYCGCEKCVGKWHTDSYTLTASGWGAEEGVTIAADESYPFGTVLYLEGMGERVVMDRGSAITGNRIDVYFESHEDALEFGMRQVRGYLVELPQE